MRRSRLNLTLPIVLVCCSVGHLALGDGAKGEIVVELSGFEHDRGSARVALFDQPDAFPTKPDRARSGQQAKVSDKKARVVFSDLPRKTYAVSVFHDENENGKLDSNFLGIPQEPIGTSNNAKGKMGPPRWDDAKFALDRAQVTQRIVVKKL